MLCRPAADDPADLDAVLDAATTAERAGQSAEARAAYERALFGVYGPAAAARSSQLLRWVARTHMAEGDVDAALDCLHAALATAEAWKDESSAGWAVNALAIVSWRRGAPDEAERLYQDAHDRALATSDGRLAAVTAQHLGILASVRADYALALRHHEASVARYRALGLTADEAGALINLGVLHRQQERWADAERALAEAGTLAHASGNHRAAALAAVNTADVLAARGAYAQAVSIARDAADLADKAGDPIAGGQAAKILGVCARETGDTDAARAELARADAIASVHGDLLLQADVARERAELARRLGQNRDLLQQLNRSHRLFAQLRARRDLADIARRTAQLEGEFVAVARRWGESIEAKDRYTQGHCQRVADLACHIAEQAGAAHGFDAQAMFWFRIGALLHDVGKIDIPEAVLNKPGKLSDDEFALMRSHTTEGVRMLADVEFPWDVRPVVESHHERWDGRGYPHGLAGEAIPLTARILCVADVYDALTSVRSYKRALSHDEAMTIMRRDVGTMFDPRVFAWFEAVAADWPAPVTHSVAHPAAQAA